MSSGKILGGLAGQLRQPVVLIHLIANQFQIRNVFHDKNIIFKISMVKRGYILRNNLGTKLHDLIFIAVALRCDRLSPPAQMAGGLLYDIRRVGVCNTEYKIAVAVAFHILAELSVTNNIYLDRFLQFDGRDIVINIRNNIFFC